MNTEATVHSMNDKLPTVGNLADAYSINAYESRERLLTVKDLTEAYLSGVSEAHVT